MAIQWQRLTLPYVRGDSHVTVLHWADPDLAAAWFRRASQLANDTARIAALDKPLESADAQLGLQQTRFMQLIVEALASGYNALNIPWYNHPTARALWREWWAGPVGGAGPQNSNTQTNEYRERPDWNDAWYKGQKSDWLFPVGAQLALAAGAGASTLGVTHFTGRLPSQAEANFRRLYPRRSYANGHPVEIIQRAGLTLGLPVDEPARENAQIVYERDVINLPFAVGQYSSGTLPDGTAVNGWLCPPPTDIFKCGGGEATEYCRLGDRSCNSGQPLAGAVFDWRAFWFDGAVELFGTEVDPRVKLSTAVPLRDHLPWLQAWATAAAAESPQQIILSARAWVWEVNATWQMVLGEETFLSKLAENPARLREQVRRPDPTATAVAGGVAVVGAAFGAVTFGISALIGGAVSTVISLADAFNAHATSGVGKDDLNRYKPVYERGWLSGDPSNAHAMPVYSVADPPDFRRNLLVALIPFVPPVRAARSGFDLIGDPFGHLPPLEGVDVVTPFQPFPFEPLPIPDTHVPTPAVPPPAGMSTATKVALAVGAVAAVGAVTYAVTRPKK